MTQIFQTHGTTVVWWLTVGAILMLVGLYVVSKVRESRDEQRSDTHEMLSNFRELHSQGELSDEEFRTIKTNLAAQLQDELNDNGDEA